MAKYTDSSETKAAINNIIKNAEGRLILISPYLQVPDQLRDTLKDMIKHGGNKGVKVILVYGKKDLNHKESEWLFSTSGIEIRWVENLHAKCYLNENEALITSMNLYQYSMENNYEMGVLLNKNASREEAEEYNRVLKDVERLCRISECKKSLFETTIPNNITQKTENNTNLTSYQSNRHSQTTQGFCIRCRDRIPFDTKAPYCTKCFKSWNRWKNRDYIEEGGFCLDCGNWYNASMNNPICKKCINNDTTSSLTSIIRKALNI